MVVQRLEEANYLAVYSSAKQRLLLFDYDGTLTPIVGNPDAAILSHEALTSIQKLAEDPRNAVWIISGRNQSFLEHVFSHLTQIGLVAEHGSFLRTPESTSWEDLTAEVNMSWQKEVIKVFQDYTDMTPGSRIEKKRAAVVWHFRQASQDYATLQAAECRMDLESKVGKVWPLEFVDGKCVLEARLKHVNKGQIAQRLVDDIRAASGKPPDFVLCFGDDATDEGDIQKRTDADWNLSDPTEVLATIMMLNVSDGYHGGEVIGQDSNSKRNSKGLPIPRSYLLES